jgi:hypothetical protein
VAPPNTGCLKSFENGMRAVPLIEFLIEVSYQVCPQTLLGPQSAVHESKPQKASKRQKAASPTQ